MDERYELLKEAQVQQLNKYNEKFVKRKLNPEKDIDTFHTSLFLLMNLQFNNDCRKEIEHPIARIAHARAIGIHLIVLPKTYQSM